MSFSRRMPERGMGVMRVVRCLVVALIALVVGRRVGRAGWTTFEHRL